MARTLDLRAIQSLAKAYCRNLPQSHLDRAALRFLAAAFYLLVIRVQVLPALLLDRSLVCIQFLVAKAG